MSLNLATANTKQPWLLTTTAMPALRQLIIGDTMVKKVPSPASLAATDLLNQLEYLEIGEDRKAGSNTAILVPPSAVPASLPVVWRVDLDSHISRLLERAHPRRTYIRIDRVHAHAADDVDPRVARLAKLGAVLAALPDLELVLVPRDFWLPTQEPSQAAEDAQRALAQALKERSVEVIAFEPDGRGGVAPHLAAFLRERERGTAASGGLQGAA